MSNQGKTYEMNLGRLAFSWFFVQNKWGEADPALFPLSPSGRSVEEAALVQMRQSVAGKSPEYLASRGGAMRLATLLLGIISREYHAEMQADAEFSDAVTRSLQTQISLWEKGLERGVDVVGVRVEATPMGAVRVRSALKALVWEEDGGERGETLRLFLPWVMIPALERCVGEKGEVHVEEISTLFSSEAEAEMVFSLWSPGEDGAFSTLFAAREASAALL